MSKALKLLLKVFFSPAGHTIPFDPSVYDREDVAFCTFMWSYISFWMIMIFWVLPC